MVSALRLSRVRTYVYVERMYGGEGAERKCAREGIDYCDADMFLLAVINLRVVVDVEVGGGGAWEERIF